MIRRRIITTHFDARINIYVKPRGKLIIFNTTPEISITAIYWAAVQLVQQLVPDAVPPGDLWNLLFLKDYIHYCTSYAFRGRSPDKVPSNIKKKLRHYMWSHADADIGHIGYSIEGVGSQAPLPQRGWAAPSESIDGAGRQTAYLLETFTCPNWGRGKQQAYWKSSLLSVSRETKAALGLRSIWTFSYRPRQRSWTYT